MLSFPADELSVGNGLKVRPIAVFDELRRRSAAFVRLHFRWNYKRMWLDVMRHLRGLIPIGPQGEGFSMSMS